MHPSEQDLVLYSSGDLAILDKLRVRWHVRSCGRCSKEVASVHALTASLRSRSDEMPAGLQWERIAAEMTANIHLGLEAGECVGPAPTRRAQRMSWRPAVVMAGMSAVLIGAWWLNPPRVERQQIAEASPVQISTSVGGLQVKGNGSALILMHTRGQQSPIIVSTPGSLRARFVDQDTGQVTINHVYSD